MKSRELFVHLTFILVVSATVVPQPVHAADCDLAGQPRINSVGVSQENCNLDVLGPAPNFVQRQQQDLSGALAKREYLETRLAKLKGLNETIPNIGSTKALIGIQGPDTETWEAERKNFDSQVKVLAESAQKVVADRQSNALARTSSLYDWLIFDNRNDISSEEYNNPTTKKASIESFEVQGLGNSGLGNLNYVRLTIKSYFPYVLGMKADAEDSFKSKSAFEDRREQISFNYATQWAQHPKFQWKVGDPERLRILESEGITWLVERRWFLDNALYETWLIRVNYPGADFNRLQFAIHERNGSVDVLRFQFTENSTTGTVYSSPKQTHVTKVEALKFAKSDLGERFVRLFQNYQDSQALSLITGREGFSYPEYMAKSADELISWGEKLQSQFESFILRSKSEVEAAIKAAADKATAELKAKQEADAKAAAANKKKTTITCAKGKLTKKVTAFNPKCPKGYRKR